MKWVFVIGGAAMVVIGGAFKLYEMNRYNEPFISGNSPWYTVFMTGVIAVILGLSFDWIMSLDDEEEEEGEPAEGEAGDAPAGPGADAEPDAAQDAPKPEAAEPPPDEAKGGEDGGEPAEGQPKPDEEAPSPEPDDDDGGE